VVRLGRCARLPHPSSESALRRSGISPPVRAPGHHAAFLGEDQLLRDAATLHGIPGVLIHGRYDVSSPLDTAWQLSRRWSTSELHVLDDAGHGGGNTFITAVVGALNRFAVT
jgi:proline iminopeptidase